MVEVVAVGDMVDEVVVVVAAGVDQSMEEESTLVPMLVVEEFSFAP
jgi:hypothetical protein